MLRKWPSSIEGEVNVEDRLSLDIPVIKVGCVVAVVLDINPRFAVLMETLAVVVACEILAVVVHVFIIVTAGLTVVTAVTSGMFVVLPGLTVVDGCFTSFVISLLSDLF